MRTLRTTVRLTSILFAAGCLTLAGCGDKQAATPAANIPSDATAADTSRMANQDDAEPVQLTSTAGADDSLVQAAETHRPEILITTSFGDIRLRLEPDKAPRTVENFLYNYVQRAFYDHTIVHYVDAGFMIAAGGYDEHREFKQPRTPIICEANNGLRNRKGTVAMAHHPDDVHSATSQFFINLADNPGLDYQPSDAGQVNGYCVFGEVIAGMDVVEKIAAVPVHDEAEFPKTPVKPVVVQSVRRVK